MKAVYQLQDKEELMELTLSDLAEGFREKFKAHPAFWMRPPLPALPLHCLPKAE